MFDYGEREQARRKFSFQGEKEEIRLEQRPGRVLERATRKGAIIKGGGGQNNLKGRFNPQWEARCGPLAAEGMKGLNLRENREGRGLWRNHGMKSLRSWFTSPLLAEK